MDTVKVKISALVQLTPIQFSALQRLARVRGFSATGDGLRAGKRLVQLMLHEAVRDAASVQHCRACGCIDGDCEQCVAATSVPCHWVEPDLCSACAAKEQAAREPHA